MVRRTSRRVGILAIAVGSLLLCLTPQPRATIGPLPDALDDRAFWTMVTTFSEPGGFFRSDNLVSNEITLQEVIPSLQAHGPASAYVGVGPDQNFTYIVGVQPRIAFIVDIRRQNMLLHLMYKALLEASPTRTEFLARLFSRSAPPDVKTEAPADDLFTAFDRAPPDDALFQQNLHDILDRLINADGGHGFVLSREDEAAIEYVYRAFYTGGPDLRYSYPRQDSWGRFPTYRELMLATDAQGVRRSYLASEADYQALRDMELRNLIVPVVGDFAGPKAIRTVASYLAAHRATVSVFYTSNVEQYLFRGDAWERFYGNVSTMPLDPHSTFVRAYFNGAGFRNFAVPAQGLRSLTLLNPIRALLAAFHRGRINSYLDVVDQSR